MEKIERNRENEWRVIFRIVPLIIVLGIAGFFLPGLPRVAAQEIQSIQPEDFTQHRLETEIIPATTLFIEVKDPEEAAQMISDSHIAQARQGWKVFDVSAYMKNGDFKGFFRNLCEGG